MKKYLLLLLSLTVFIPSVALASWWNPSSWFSNQSTETKTEILEKKVQELENKLQNTTNTKELGIIPAATPDSSSSNRPPAAGLPKVEKNVFDLQKKIDSLTSENNNLKGQLSKKPTETITEKVVYQAAQCDTSVLNNRINELTISNQKLTSAAQQAVVIIDDLRAKNKQFTDYYQPMVDKMNYLKADSEKSNSLLNTATSQLEQFSTAVIRLQKLSDGWKEMYYKAIGQPIPN